MVTGGGVEGSSLTYLNLGLLYVGIDELDSDYKALIRYDRFEIQPNHSSKK